MRTWPPYGVSAAVYATELRRTAPDVPVVAGRGRVFGTYAADTVAAREAALVEDLIPVALRRWRKQEGLSQRAAAELLDVGLGVVFRAEAQPDGQKLGTLVSLLRQIGYDLQVVSAEGSTLSDDLKAEEIFARTRSGRRFAGASEVVRLTNEPRWMAERGQSFQTHGPQWTGERRPGQYP